MCSLYFNRASRLKRVRVRRVQLKEAAKKSNLKLVAEQKVMMNQWRELKTESDKKFGAEIKQATDRIEALDKEIVDMREESLQLNAETRYSQVSK